MSDEFEAKPGSAVHMPLLSEALINFAFNQAQEFVDNGQSVREATSICANLLLDAAWKVAASGAVADGFDPNKDKFRACVEAVLERVSFSKVDDDQASDTPPPSSHVDGSEPAIIRLPWFKEPHSDFWRAEAIGHVYEVHDDEMADYKKRQCQYDFEARIRSVLVPLATTEGSTE